MSRLNLIERVPYIPSIHLVLSRFTFLMRFCCFSGQRVYLPSSSRLGRSSLQSRTSPSLPIALFTPRTFHANAVPFIDLFVFLMLSVGSACISLLALGWAVAAYSHALRQAYQSHYSRHALALFTQTLCHMLIAAARVASIVAFAAVFQYWVFLALGSLYSLLKLIVGVLWIKEQTSEFRVSLFSRNKCVEIHCTH